MKYLTTAWSCAAQKSVSFTSQDKILEKLVLCILNSNKWNVTEILFEKPIKIQHWL